MDKTSNAGPVHSKSSHVSVAVIDANPNQPRRTFDETELVSLRESIRNHGVLQPLVVRQVGKRYQLIAGERRLRAVRALGLSEVPVRVVDFNDQQVMEAALVENIQRMDLNPIEKAQGFRDYLARFRMTHEELGKRLGISRTVISNLLGLLDLADDVQSAIRGGALSTSHAKILKGVSDKGMQSKLCKEIILRNLSVDATDILVKQALGQGQDPAAKKDKGDNSASDEKQKSERPVKDAVAKTNHVMAIENELRQKLLLRVEIKLSGADRGQLVVRFENNDDFERLVEILRR
jgi:ParB family transcriptional regulator, chromosome partitioning protein